MLSVLAAANEQVSEVGDVVKSGSSNLMTETDNSGAKFYLEVYYIRKTNCRASSYVGFAFDERVLILRLAYSFAGILA